MTHNWGSTGPPTYLKRQGLELAAANKICSGARNNNGKFYTCVKTKLNRAYNNCSNIKSVTAKHSCVMKELKK